MNMQTSCHWSEVLKRRRCRRRLRAATLTICNAVSSVRHLSMTAKNTMPEPVTTSLCSHCRQIPFDGFRCPTMGRLEASRKAQETSDSKGYQHAVWGRDLCSYEGSWKIMLGTWGRMVKDSTWCDMCRLFCQVVTRRGATYMAGRPLNAANEDVVLYTTGKTFAAVTESLRDLDGYLPDKLAYIRRIGLEVRLKKDEIFDGVLVKEYESLAIYNDVAQACHMQDDFERLAALAPRPSERGTSGKHMLFRGRRRPDTVEIELLQRWLNICKTEHSMTCQKVSTDQLVKT